MQINNDLNTGKVLQAVSIYVQTYAVIIHSGLFCLTQSLVIHAYSKSKICTELLTKMWKKVQSKL